MAVLPLPDELVGAVEVLLVELQDKAVVEERLGTVFEGHLSSGGPHAAFMSIEGRKISMA